MSKTNTRFLVLGSGIGGLSAGAALKEYQEDFIIVDKLPELPKNLHNGLHYLHSIDFGIPFPFEFKKITMTEEIWDVRKDEFKKKATLPEMFDYSKKIMENVRHPSSILDPGKFDNEVFLPQSNNLNDLLAAYELYIGNKFMWGMSLKSIDRDGHIAHFENGDMISYENLITTIPIKLFCKTAGLTYPYEFKNKTLFITNYHTTNIVPNWLIVLYISDPKFPPYRVTVMNNILSMESMYEISNEQEIIIKYHMEDLFDYELSSKSSYVWEQGRIFGIGIQERLDILKTLSQYNIYPIGRFALWNGKLRMDTTAMQGKKVVEVLHFNNEREPLLIYLSK